MKQTIHPEDVDLFLYAKNHYKESSLGILYDLKIIFGDYELSNYGIICRLMKRSELYFDYKVEELVSALHAEQYFWPQIFAKKPPDMFVTIAHFYLKPYTLSETRWLLKTYIVNPKIQKMLER